MKASELFFGVEIEAIAPIELVSSCELYIGPYHRGQQVSFLPEGWRAERDGSIDAGCDMPCEIVSPKLSGDEGIRQVVQVVKILQEKGFRVNASCGVHVSVSWDPNAPTKALQRLCQIVSYLEPAIYASTGTRSRERGRWCQNIKQFGNAKYAADYLKSNDHYRRYHVLNLTNLTSGQDRVEFRAFSGSLNELKIASWIQMCLGIVERAHTIKSAPMWTPAPIKDGSPLKRKGLGETELERLFYFLAWTKSARTQKKCEASGIVSSVFSEDEMKNRLRLLAKKYDECA